MSKYGLDENKIICQIGLFAINLPHEEKKIWTKSNLTLNFYIFKKKYLGVSLKIHFGKEKS